MLNRRSFFGGLLMSSCVLFSSLCFAQSDSVITTISVGSNPNTLLYNPTNNKIYCANSGNDNVTVMDGDHDTVITTLVVGDYPGALAYNPANNKIYCANYGSNNVTIIAGAGDTVITTLNAGDYPLALAYSPTNSKIYCANHASANLTIIAGADDTVITTLKLTSYTWALACNPTNHKIYCADWSDNVNIIDGAGDSVITALGVGNDPRALAYNSTNSKIYCANYDDSSISVIACSPLSAVEEDQETQVIPSFSLKQNYPNPFNPTTKILFTVHGSQFIVHSLLPTTLKIYNILGQKLRTLVDEPKSAGNYEVIWDGKDDRENEVASGIYFYQLKVGGFTETKKMLLLR